MSGVRGTPQQVHRLANRIVEAILRQGYVKPKKDPAVLKDRVADLLQKNFEEEEALEDEAERIARSRVRQMVGVDQAKMVQLIKRKLAEERGFPL